MRKISYIIIAVLFTLIVIDLSYFSRYEKRFDTWLIKNGFTHTTLNYTRFDSSETVSAQLFKANYSTDTLIILLHGGGNDGLFPSVGLIKSLLFSGYEIMTFDIDGHGRNSTSMYQSDSVLSCFRCFFQSNTDRLKGKTVFLVGYSLGGAIMLHSLSVVQDKIDGAIAISIPTTLEINKSVASELLCFLKGSYYRQLKNYGMYGLIPAAGFFKRGQYPVRIKENINNNKKPWENYISFFSKTIDKMSLKDSVQSITIPILYISGTNDQIASHSDMEDLDRLSPNSKLIMLDGETHLTTLLSQSTEKNILCWLKGIR